MVLRDEINIKKGNINLSLVLFTYEQHGDQVIYSPALDLAGFGDTLEEAKSAFDDSMQLYLEFVLTEETFETELHKLGWKKKKFYNHRFKPKPYEFIEIMNEKGVSSFRVMADNRVLPRIMA